MPITRSQQREIDRKEEEEREREEGEKKKKNELRMAIQASLASLPASLKSLEENMNNLNTHDDICLATSASIRRTLYRYGRPLGREHTDPLDQPLNMNPVKRTDTQIIPEFTPAHKSAYKALRRESMFGVVSDTDTSATYRSNSSGGSLTEAPLPRERLSNLSMASELDILEYRATSNGTTVQVTEERRESVSTLGQTDSTTTYDEFSINTDHHTTSTP